MCQASLCSIRAFVGKVFFFPSLSGNSTVWVAISHKLPQIVLRAFRPSLYPKDLSYDAACTSLPSPHSLVADANICATSWSLLVVAVRHIFCFFLFLSQLCCPLRFQNSHRPTCERVSYCVETSPPSRLPPQVRSPSLTFLSLFSSSIFCPTSFPREWAAFLGAWCSLPVFRSCFVGFAQCSNVLSMNMWGRKWSPHPIPPSS